MSNFNTPPAQKLSADHALDMAYQLLGHGRLAEAEALCNALLLASQAVPVRLLEAEIASAKGNLTGAKQVLQQALGQHTDSAALHYKIAQLAWATRARTDALFHIRIAAQCCGDDLQLLHAIAQFFLDANNPAEALPFWLRVLSAVPEQKEVLFKAALCHYYVNDMSAAEQLLNKVLSLYPAFGDAIHLRSKLKTSTKEQNYAEDIRRRLPILLANPADLAAAQYALSKELEDIGDYRAAFDALLEGAATKRKTLDYDVKTELAAMRRVCEHYTEQRLASITDGDTRTGPIFIVGMPRTGTTLVERILASHRDVVSVGETTDFPVQLSTVVNATREQRGLPSDDLVSLSSAMDFSELGRSYFDAASQLADGNAYFIDKLPFNFRYCGLILKALPKARIIHLTRDPMDTCYAVFKTLFYNVYHFSYQLDELAEFYIGYRRVMAHWHQVMPGRILDVSYESLVTSQEEESRRILNWCGLPWQDEVLEFHKTDSASTTASAAQIRRPIYRSSVQKWRQVAEQMEPVRQRLQAAGLVDADGNPC